MACPRRAAAVALTVMVTLGQCLVAASAADAHRPAAFEAVYTIKARGVAVGRMTRRLQFDADDGFHFSSIMEAEGLLALLKPTRIVEQSEGHWPAVHPAPERYSYSKQAGKKRKETVLAFDRAAGRTHATVNGTAVDGPLDAGAIDKLSYQLAVMRDLAAGVGELTYVVANPGESKPYVLERRAPERVTVGGRVHDTVPVAYARDDGRRTVLWCDAALDYLPVKIQYTEKDGAVTTAELVAAPAP